MEYIVNNKIVGLIQECDAVNRTLCVLTKIDITKPSSTITEWVLGLSPDSEPFRSSHGYIGVSNLDKYPAFQGKIKRHLIDSLMRDMDYTTFKEDIKFFNRMTWANNNIPVDFSQVFLNLQVFLSSHVIFYLRKVSCMLKIFRFELWCLGVWIQRTYGYSKLSWKCECALR